MPVGVLQHLCHLRFIVNLSDTPVMRFADDRVRVPLFVLEPGMGSHVAPGQAFSAGQ